MKKILSLLFILISSFVSAQTVSIPLADGSSVDVIPMADNAVRIRHGVVTLTEHIYLGEKPVVKAKVRKKDGKTIIALPKMKVEVNTLTGGIDFTDASGKKVLGEESYGLDNASVHGEDTHVATATFDSPEVEQLFGLGQFQDGYMNVRGLPRRLTQVNTQIAIPMVTSSRGYSLLWNNYGLTYFNPCSSSVALEKQDGEGRVTEVNVTSTEGGKIERRQENLFHGTITVDEEGDYAFLLDVGQKMARRHHLTIDGETVLDLQNIWLPPTTSVIRHLKKGTHTLSSELTRDDRPVVFYGKVGAHTTFSSPVAEAVDYTVFVGKADECIASYRLLTGQSPMPPLWAMGYVHCRERYHSTDEILSNARQFRNKKLPMDVMVQDWQWWGPHGWNSFRFDEANYPNPKLLVDSLHAMGSRLMLSVWSKIDDNSAVGREAKSRGYYIPGTTWIDFFNEDAARFYWQNFSSKLLRPYGIDCWWQDATEPENDDLVGRKVNNGTTLGEVYRNLYPNLVSKVVYEGSRADAPDHRTLILTRSGFPGIHRYGSFLWSGDVGNDWQTLRYQLTAGLGLMAAGHPWWTYDAGGFFRPSNQYADKSYHERFLRWLQIATFLPMMRVHGYVSETEFWRYGEQVENLSRQQLQLRYSLLPYNYSCAYAVTKGSTMLRPLVMDFASDKQALKSTNEYMFGPSLLVCAVLEEGIRKMDVYLPASKGGWYDLHTGKRVVDANSSPLPMHKSAAVALDRIPVYVKGGSIIPMAPSMQTTDSYVPDTTDIVVYPGCNAMFELYEDEGVNYNYEQGRKSVIKLHWKDSQRTLIIGKREGSYEGMPQHRVFRVQMAGTSTPVVVKYDGDAVKVKL